MKKVININFQGRVIPIEESAYDVLKVYVESLRRFFANEEGRDEIINDIEGRIAELFGESLKKGSTCITDEDVNNIINSMGRPEDFEGEESNMQSQLGGNQQQQSNFTQDADHSASRGRLYRDTNEKMLGGVCSGIAAYFRIDPTVVRLLFLVLFFGGGSGFLLYLLLWIILPSKPLDHVTSNRRLYRNPEEKVIAGVASGIATYFDIAVWIPRLIFALPLVVGIISSFVSSLFWFEFNPFPGFIFGSFGGTLFVIYAVLWAVIPEAKSASEKLEMRGEKVDLNTIKNTIQEDLEGFKARAEKWGGEFSEKAKEFSSEFSSTVNEKSKQFASEASSVSKKGGNKLANAIGILFKAFFLFLAGILAFTILVALLGMIAGSVSVFPLKSFFLEGFWQNFLAWTTLILFLFVPAIGLLTWLVRRIIGATAGSKYLGFTFGGLWTLGWISVILLIASIAQNFDAGAKDKGDIKIVQPTSSKLTIKVAESNLRVVSGKWFRMDGLLRMDDDSLVLNNVRVRIAKSPDSLYRVSYVKFSNGSDENAALRNIAQINYGATQQDSVIYLDRGFKLNKGTKFRNQGVTVTIFVPVGKKIEIDDNVSRRLNHISFNSGRNDYDWDDEWNNEGYESWMSNQEYIMTPGGLERVKKAGEINDEDEDENDSDSEKSAIEEYKKSREELRKEYERKQKEAEDLKKELDKPVDTTRYRYQKVAIVDPHISTPVGKTKMTESPDIIELGSELGRFSLLNLQS
ncbi:PspC domain-containing protein [Sediminibacterium sp.]|uniref:PspC domain-containing protein n=1 Tax=Sediminibacterium sp. TaxID=1917865 RepID=UPI0025F7E889|nr:PspC domain-containing protein [Sediminibacterium sp.]MBT9485432.1 PspC domain-containing protein [Sediminibacterium sp.]